MVLFETTCHFKAQVLNKFECHSLGTGSIRFEGFDIMIQALWDFRLQVSFSGVMLLTFTLRHGSKLAIAMV